MSRLSGPERQSRDAQADIRTALLAPHSASLRAMTLAGGVVAGLVVWGVGVGAVRLPDSWKGPYWEPRDIWVGVYWADETREDIHGVTFLWFRSVYVCLVPCFPVRMRWRR